MFGEHADKAFQRSQNGPVHHDRTMPGTILPHILEVEALRQGKIHLNGGKLPLAPDSISHLDIDLGPVERAIAFIDPIGLALFLHGLDQGVGRQFPGFVRPDTVSRARGDENAVGEPEEFHEVGRKMHHPEDFLFQLFRCAQNMRIVLRKLADAQKPVQCAGLFMPVHHAQLEHAHGQIAVGTLVLVVHEHVSHAIHGLDAVYVAFDLCKIHIGAIMIVMAGFFPQLAAQNLRPLHKLIAAFQMLAAQKIFQNGTQQHPLGKPEGHTGSDIFMKTEQIKFLAQLAMITAFGLFNAIQMGLECLFIPKRRSINT